MRPDAEEYEEMESPQAEPSRALSWLVLAAAVGGFATLAFFAYNSGTKTPEGQETLVVEADNTPIKQAPSAPDGEQFPDKDKTIYEVIAPSAGEQRTPEKLLPEAEKPVAAANMEDSEDEPAASAAAKPAPAAPAPAPEATSNTTTFVASEEPAPKPAKPADAAKAEASAAVSNAVQTVSEQPVATKSSSVVEKSYATPEIINEKKATAKVESKPKEVAETPKAKEAKKQAEKAPAAGGSYKIQLGAFKSEEEASRAWKKYSGQHASVLSGSPSIVKAELPNGTFYRLRAGSYASASDAKAACSSLAGLACMPVK